MIFSFSLGLEEENIFRMSANFLPLFFSFKKQKQYHPHFKEDTS